MKVKLYNQSAKEKGTVDLPDSVFGLKWNEALVHQVVMGQMANARPKVAHAKDRSEVRGGGRKPWRQKGTGRARHGSIRSPIWKGGGVTHGPLTEKNYTKKINKKMAQAALKVVLSAKARDNEVILVDDIKFPEAKTKFAAEVFKGFSYISNFSNITKGSGVLVALSAGEKNTKVAIKNLPYASADDARNLYAAKALQYKYIMFTQNALETFKTPVRK